jgi:hypothetical protein
VIRRSRTNRWPVRQTVASVVLAVSLTGCGQPQLGNDPAGLRLAMKMQTAVMAKRSDLIDQVMREADALAEAQQLSVEVYAEIRSVVELTQSNDWPAAQNRWLRFAKGQRPEAPPEPAGPR